MKTVPPFVVRIAVAVCLAAAGLSPAVAAPEAAAARRVVTIAPGEPIQRALDDAMPGDVIRLLPGVHNARLLITRGGDRGRPVTLEGAEGAVLDVARRFEAEWSPRPELGEHVYSIPMPYAVGHVVADGRTVVMLDERRNLAATAGAVPQWREIFRNGVQGRWEGVGGVAMYRSGTGELLVRFADGRDPRRGGIVCAPLGVEGTGIRIEGADRVVIRGIELRHARVGIAVRDSVGSVVEHCRIGRTRDGIELLRGSDRCTVRFNTITQDPLGVNHGANRAMPDGQFNDPAWKLAWDLWIAHKRFGFYDSRAIMIDRTLGGHRVHDNHIHDHWDGISTRHWDSWKASAPQRLAWSVYNPGIEVHHNRIERLNDDALEPNDGGVDQRWHHNIVVNARCALRLKMIDKGPAYFYANQFKDNGEDIRCYGEQELNPAEIYVYHNSGTARRALNSNKVFGIGTPNYHFANNVSWAEAWWGNLASDAPNWKGDHNVHVRRGNLDTWDAQRAQARAAGIDVNSRWVDAGGASPYADAGSGDFRLTEDSPARGAGANAAALEKWAGRSLPGLEEFAGAPDAVSVDAGAVPYGAPLPRIPRAPAEVEVEPAGHWPDAR